MTFSSFRIKRTARLRHSLSTCNLALLSDPGSFSLPRHLSVDDMLRQRIWPFSTVGLFALVSISAVWLLTPVIAIQYDYGFDVHGHLAKRRHGPFGIARRDAPFVVTGIAGHRNGTLPARQEVRQLEKNTDLWTLFILGLNMMQYTDQSHVLSYYQIAGIHGVPWVPWAGVDPTPGSENTGYCRHISELFLTWHRPYLALYEVRPPSMDLLSLRGWPSSSANHPAASLALFGGVHCLALHRRGRTQPIPGRRQELPHSVHGLGGTATRGRQHSALQRWW